MQAPQQTLGFHGQPCRNLRPFQKNQCHVWLAASHRDSPCSRPSFKQSLLSTSVLPIQVTAQVASTTPLVACRSGVCCRGSNAPRPLAALSTRCSSSCTRAQFPSLQSPPSPLSCLSASVSQSSNSSSAGALSSCGSPLELAGVGSNRLQQLQPCAASKGWTNGIKVLLDKAYRQVVMFVVFGIAMAAALIYWSVGGPMRTVRPYTFQATFAQAPGVFAGTRVTMKGVNIGTVKTCKACLDHVELALEINEHTTTLPQGSVFEFSQTGMIPEPYVNVVPPENVHLPADLASPADPKACRLQGVLICAGDQVQGRQGGSLDELTGHMLKSVRAGKSESGIPGRG